jgi:hypothetical protein
MSTSDPLRYLADGCDGNRVSADGGCDTLESRRRGDPPGRESVAVGVLFLLRSFVQSDCYSASDHIGTGAS